MSLLKLSRVSQHTIVNNVRRIKSIKGRSHTTGLSHIKKDQPIVHMHLGKKNVLAYTIQSIAGWSPYCCHLCLRRILKEREWYMFLMTVFEISTQTPITSVINVQVAGMAHYLDTDNASTEGTCMHHE
jgi:hypothetical protein